MKEIEKMFDNKISQHKSLIRGNTGLWLTEIYKKKSQYEKTCELREKTKALK